MPVLPTIVPEAATAFVQTAPDSAATSVWRPHASVMTLFMRNEVACPICRLKQECGAAKAARRLHVVARADTLVITTVDDLHAPGASVCGRRIMAWTGAAMYRLTAEPVAGVAREHQARAAGIAVLSWTPDRRYRLEATGLAEGLPCDHERIFDAVTE